MRLFHCEYDCYIAAEGSFAEDPAVIEDGKQPLSLHPLSNVPISPNQSTAGSAVQTMAS